jgi:hypothetical protein
MDMDNSNMNRQSVSFEIHTQISNAVNVGQETASNAMRDLPLLLHPSH